MAIRDETMILLKAALIETGLSELESERIVLSIEANGDAVKRLEELEPRLDEIIKAYEAGKKWATAFITLMLANYGLDIAESAGILEVLLK